MANNNVNINNDTVLCRSYIHCNNDVLVRGVQILKQHNIVSILLAANDNIYNNT